MKVESPQGSGDDTAANAFDLRCDDYGEWGSWPRDRCSYQSYIVGFRAKIESPQYSGDDTALNSVALLCSDHKVLYPRNEAPWGNHPSSFSQCRARTSVCGFRQKVESNQGSGDDTALNAIQLYCCYSYVF